MYVNDIKTGMTVSDKEPEILKESVATAWVDGNNVLGKQCEILFLET